MSPIAKNIYGVTKVAAENLCQLFRRKFGLPCLVLRTSRFFPEADDNKQVRENYVDANIKANEYLYRRVDVADIVDAHLLVIDKAPTLGFGSYIISATTPFSRDDLPALRSDAPALLRRLFPAYVGEYARRGWRMFDTIDRVYVNDLARRELGWRPRYDFGSVLERLSANEDFRSPLAQAIGAKGYHESVGEEGPFPLPPRGHLTPRCAQGKDSHASRSTRAGVASRCALGKDSHASRSTRAGVGPRCAQGKDSGREMLDTFPLGGERNRDATETRR